MSNLAPFSFFTVASRHREMGKKAEAELEARGGSPEAVKKVVLGLFRAGQVLNSQMPDFRGRLGLGSLLEEHNTPENPDKA